MEFEGAAYIRVAGARKRCLLVRRHTGCYGGAAMFLLALFVLLALFLAINHVAGRKRRNSRGLQPAPRGPLWRQTGGKATNDATGARAGDKAGARTDPDAEEPPFKGGGGDFGGGGASGGW